MILVLWALALYVGMSILSATIMSISSRAKMTHRWTFEFVNRLAFGKKYKKPQKSRGGRGREEENQNVSSLPIAICTIIAAGKEVSL